MNFTFRDIKKVFAFLLVLSCLFVFLFLMGCEEKIEKAGAGQVAEKLTCTGCHTDAESLQLLATPEPPPSSSGGG